jgi:DNA (cytosine-5)-methyltransferase 1
MKIVCEERTDEGLRLFKDGCCGTIRTIDGGGDKRVIEAKEIGNIYADNGYNSQAGRVYDKKGLSPTLDTCSGGNKMPKIITPVIVASRGRNQQNQSDTEQRLEPNSEGVCNTLTSVQKDNLVLEPTVKIKQATKEGHIDCKLGGVADLSYPKIKTRRGRVKDNGDTCPTLTATETGICRIETPYRIRKLTPLECWRLMGFTDDDFHKAESVNSNTQLYKQAGNSICVPVLEAIFKQLL